MPAEEPLDARRRRRRIAELAHQLKEAANEDGASLGVSADGQLVIEEQILPTEKPKPPEGRVLKLVPVTCPKCRRIWKFVAEG